MPQRIPAPQDCYHCLVVTSELNNLPYYSSPHIAHAMAIGCSSLVAILSVAWTSLESHANWNQHSFQYAPQPHPDASDITMVSSNSLPANFIKEILFQLIKNSYHQLRSDRMLAFSLMWCSGLLTPAVASNSLRMNVRPA